MAPSNPMYTVIAARTLRAAMGGYPALHSLPKGFSDSNRIENQIDASDRAFLRAGMSRDGTHCEQVNGFHPLMHALRESTQVKSERQAWVKAAKQDLWDATTALDRLTGGVTVIVHTDCDMSETLINRAENSFADVYFTPYWQRALASGYQEPLTRIVNQFISDIQVPAVEQHRAALDTAFGIKSTANRNLANYNSIPAVPVPSRMRDKNLPTSPWRGQPTPFTIVAEPHTPPAIAAPLIDLHNPITPPRFKTTTVPPFPMVKVAWPGLPTAIEAAELETQPVPAAPPVTNPNDTVSQTSPESMYGDSQWFASHEVLSAVDKASTAVAQQVNIRSAVTSPTLSRTLSSDSSISTRTRCSPSKVVELSDSDSDVDIRAALQRYARPLPHIRPQHPGTPCRIPTLDVNPHMSPISISSSLGSDVSSVGTSTSVIDTPAPVAHLHAPYTLAHGHFNPIISPGPCTESWLTKYGWAPQWANVVRKVAETNMLGKWVEVLVKDYGVSRMSAEALKACVMEDYESGGSISGSGPLGC